MNDFEQARDLHRKGNLKEALSSYLAALNANFDNDNVLFYLGVCLFEAGHHGAAASFLARCLLVKPSRVDALIHLGACYRNENNFAAAQEVWTMARESAKRQAMTADEAGALANLAALLVHQGRHKESIAVFNEAESIDPSNGHVRANRAMAHLALGHWREGWADYDTHLMLNSRRERRYVNTPAWRGEDGMAVVVYGEQGVGDEILYASMVPDLMKVCSRVIFDCHPRLVSTWERSFGIPCYGTRKTSDIPWFDTEKPDASVAIGSLGRYFRNEEAEFPGTPYLKPNQAMVTRHRPWARGVGRPRIGLSWKGGTKITGAPFRQISLHELAPLFNAVDADWFSLQYTDGALEEVLGFEEQTGIRLKHYPSYVNPFDLSGLVDFTASLDLVITVPTTILHVAGALGVPCWVLTHHEAAWRESGNADCEPRREKMVWYNSVKLLHKVGPTWGPLIAMVAQDLADYRTPASQAAE